MFERARDVYVLSGKGARFRKPQVFNGSVSVSAAADNKVTAAGEASLRKI